MLSFNVLLDILDRKGGLITEVAHPVICFLDWIIIFGRIISQELIQLLVSERGTHDS